MLHWLPIAQRIDYKILIVIVKALHGLAPGYIQDFISVSKRSRTLRFNDQLLIQVPKTVSVSYGDRSFSYSAPLLWNKLPMDCRKADTIDHFKTKL